MSKRALIVGINDFKTVTNLRGCINDTIEMSSLLGAYYDFGKKDVKILQDSDATAQGIQDGLAWLLSDYAGDGSDVRFFHFSSHGTQVPDQDETEEWERKDEVIVPHDHDWDNPFRDDELRTIFGTIPENVNFTFIADCCHSGTIQRELLERGIDFVSRYVTPPAEMLDTMRAMQEQRDADADAWAAAQLAQMLQDVPPEQWAMKMQEYLTLLRRRFRENRYAVLPEDHHALLAACEDRQTAADAFIDGEYRGAFTWGLSKAIKESNGDLTYDELITRAGANIDRYVQIPQLECPETMLSLKFLAPLAG